MTPNVPADYALVTGASGSVGYAIAHALAGRGMGLLLTGQDPGKLDRAARELAAAGTTVATLAADLATDEGIRNLATQAAARLPRLDVLVHAAGVIRLGNIEAAGWEDLDHQFRVNLRAPFLLTKALLPMLKAARGQVLFVNSSAGLSGGADNVGYAATKHALRALAAGIRDRVNADGVRVISVFPGRTASPMQEAVHRFEGRPYDPARLLQPVDVAAVVVSALSVPRTAEVTDVMVRPMMKPSSGEGR